MVEYALGALIKSGDYLTPVFNSWFCEAIELQ
jgi:hypothetical protein